MSKLRVVAISLVCLAAILFAGSRLWSWERTFRPPGSAEPEGFSFAQGEKPFIDYTSHVLRNPAPAVSSKAEIGNLPVAGITSHHLPTAETFIHEFYTQLKQARADIRTFLIVGPDHFEQCKGMVSTTGKNFLTPFGEIENDGDLTRALLESGTGENDNCFANEHSIGVETTFIKKYFPDAKVSAVLFSSAAPVSASERLAKAVAEKFPTVFVVQSTDFSHYDTKDAANRIDAGTQAQILRRDVTGLKLEQVDSPAALRFTIFYANLRQARPGWLVHANSSDFTGKPENTTGYFNVIYSK